MLPRVNVVKCEEADYILFSTNDAISNVLYLTGAWQEYLLMISRFMLSSIQQPLVLDIGANLGAYAVPMAKHLRANGGQVIAFEPQRTVYYQLCGNTVLNRLDNLVAHNLALGEAEGLVEIPEIDYSKHHNIGAFSLDQSYRRHLNTERYYGSPANQVRITTLDDFPVPRSPSLVKIDVEGFELKVLQGATQFLAEHEFPPILFEAWSHDWFASDKKALLDFIAQQGYVISLNFGDEFVAQHPNHPVQTTFATGSDGTIHMMRTR